MDQELIDAARALSRALQIGSIDSLEYLRGLKALEKGMKPGEGWRFTEIWPTTGEHSD